MNTSIDSLLPKGLEPHQDAVKVISSHIGGGSWQQGPRLTLVVCDETLDVIVHQFVGEVHAVYSLHLRKEKKKNNTSIVFQDVSVMMQQRLKGFVN